MCQVTDLKAARDGFREFLAKYNEYGKVPRDAIRPLEGRVRTLEQAIRNAEEAEWRRTDPEARKRAADTVEMFSVQIDEAQRAGRGCREAGRQEEGREDPRVDQDLHQWLTQAARPWTSFRPEPLSRPG